MGKADRLGMDWVKKLGFGELTPSPPTPLPSRERGAGAQSKAPGNVSRIKLIPRFPVTEFGGFVVGNRGEE